MKKEIVTHRGTYESIKAKERNKKIEANYPKPDYKISRLLEDNRKVVWVSKGNPTILNKIFSGMVWKRDQARIVFCIDKERLQRPNGISKNLFSYIFNAQYVIVGDVDLPPDAEFQYNK